MIWHDRFLGLAKHVADSWSKDPSTKVGAVIVDPETNIVVGMGYNGFPRGVDDNEERYNDREVKRKLVCHAELNAILNANKSVRGCDIYVYPTIMKPASCSECSKAISQAGIKRLFYRKTDNVSERWIEDSKFSKVILDEAGVECIEIEGN